MLSQSDRQGSNIRTLVLVLVLAAAIAATCFGSLAVFYASQGKILGAALLMVTAILQAANSGYNLARRFSRG
jgi:hypothetical protein